ncbi:MAG: RNA polymerase subunit sigma-54 [Ignavibacteriales bacterium CG_4_9_14_3_um_filter_30_11]|nr:MAG: RNA polymerase subunit sigma-54 [Ignavibacteriales bacterium CG_4_9_14_3_um_filter_30_11]
MHNKNSLTIITQNETMREILARIDMISDSDSSVLLIGETGVGKEIFAEYIHRTSSRALKTFVKIGLAALPSELLSSELFGHEKGAYTSASTEKKGLFEIADAGSIFLDDIDDVPIDIQTKLLRVLESRELMRIGGTTPIQIDVRLITASKVDLKELVNRGIFRADLFYRINVVPIRIPPLRERRDDIPPLVEHFLKYFQPQKSISVSKEAMRALVNYPFPGNVRELKNLIQRISLFVNGEINLNDLPSEIKNENPVETLIKACNKCYIDGQMSLDQIVHCLEHNLLNEALNKAKGNQSLAAKELGLSLSTFRDKIKKYNLK